MIYILRAKHIESPHLPECIVAWNIQPDLELAALECWEVVADMEALEEAIEFSPKPGEREQVVLASEG